MYKRIIKRIIDFIVSFFGLIFLSPIFLIVMLVLSVNNRGSVFFLQERPGKKGRIFKIIKFKTMTDKKDSQGDLLPDIARHTVLGKFIRSTSLDEAPQLINVLMGDMSLIGPRPLLSEYLPLYNHDQEKRHQVRPGITGWAQVNGRNAISWTKKFELDVWYVNHISFVLDIKIVLRTILKVVKSEGVNPTNLVSTEKFNGYN